MHIGRLVDVTDNRNIYHAPPFAYLFTRRNCLTVPSLAAAEKSTVLMSDGDVAEGPLAFPVATLYAVLLAK